MTSSLAGLLQQAPSARMFRGRVTAITGLTLTVTYGAGAAQQVAFLDTYSPQMGDQVYGLVQDGFGMLVLGSDNAPITAAAGPPEPAVFVIDPRMARTVHEDGAPPVEGQPVSMGGDDVGVWGYDPAVLAAEHGRAWGALDIEVTRLTGSGPPVFELVMADGMPPVLTQGWSSAMPSPDVATWLPLPVSWADELGSGRAAGVAVRSAVYHGRYRGGRLRFTEMT